METGKIADTGGIQGVSFSNGELSTIEFGSATGGGLDIKACGKEVILNRCAGDVERCGSGERLSGMGEDVL